VTDEATNSGRSDAASPSASAGVIPSLVGAPTGRNGRAILTLRLATPGMEKLQTPPHGNRWPTEKFTNGKNFQERR